MWAADVSLPELLAVLRNTLGARPQLAPGHPRTATTVIGLLPRSESAKSPVEAFSVHHAQVVVPQRAHNLASAEIRR
ncbi:hypothetical protein [Saccharopolyspora sp. ASAGF58]|uniref:hypothetical protein n=1 Tax=Saccharopolyspora sp. ASAGF58 TaxID=2719023 RepID=UPI001447F79A|nr:hypothetical protein [Saccharopolyspora sp. ASAGF58]